LAISGLQVMDTLARPGPNSSKSVPKKRAIPWSATFSRNAASIALFSALIILPPIIPFFVFGFSLKNTTLRRWHRLSSLCRRAKNHEKFHSKPFLLTLNFEP
jgi:hypothetical protein